LLLVELRKALGKDELDTAFAQFLIASAKFPKPQREAATREFLARGCAGEGKGAAYLLAMIRDGAGQRGAPTDKRGRFQQPVNDTGGARAPGVESTNKWRAEEEAHAAIVRKERAARGGKAPDIMAQVRNGKHS